MEIKYCILISGIPMHPMPKCEIYKNKDFTYRVTPRKVILPVYAVNVF